jgi:hypothetical protein
MGLCPAALLGTAFVVDRPQTALDPLQLADHGEPRPMEHRAPKATASWSREETFSFR